MVQTDASGTLEAVKAALSGLPQGSVVLRYLLAVPNDITESDVDLAAASKGLILAFNVEPSEAVLAAAKHQGTSWGMCRLFGLHCICLQSSHILYVSVSWVTTEAAMTGHILCIYILM